MPSDDAPDENIPLQGAHRANEPDDPLTSSVRAQQPPPDPTPPAGPAADDDSEEASEDTSASAGELGDYQLSRDSGSGRYRMSLRPPAEEGTSPGGGFREISRHSSPEDMSDALDGQLPDGPRFVVLEDTQTGAVRMDRGNALGDNWLAGDYDQATVFETEEEAAAYADERRETDASGTQRGASGGDDPAEADDTN